MYSPECDGLPLDHGEVAGLLLEVLAVLGLERHLREVDGRVAWTGETN